MPYPSLLGNENELNVQYNFSWPNELIDIILESSDNIITSIYYYLVNVANCKENSHAPKKVL